MDSSWHKSDWRGYKIAQQPTYNDKKALNLAETKLSNLPPLVFAGEARNLLKKLKKVANGKAFLLQGGDCAESFSEFNSNSIRDTLRVILQMAVVLTYGARKPVIKVGRIAGQFAKPRSEDFEIKNGVSLPSFRGDVINSIEFNEAAREPDPQRMLQTYYQSAITLNLLRAFASGGFADLGKIHRLNLVFTEEHEQREFLKVSQEIKQSMDFIAACGINSKSYELATTDIFTSHEALLMPYEEALTRQDSLTGKWYNCSAHMLWIGERTRDPDSAHVRFLSGVENPIGIKISQKITADELLKLCDTLNPENRAGRLTLITRMGAGNLGKHLPTLIRAIEKEKRKVIWSCDPMHGNTEKLANDYKTRRFDRILQEVREFFAVHKDEGSYPGGIHLEMTGADVTECVGGLQNVIHENSLSERYHTQCDPRLNATQVLDLAFLIANELKS